MPSQIGFGKTLRDHIFQVVTNTEKQLPVFTAGFFLRRVHLRMKTC